MLSGVKGCSSDGRDCVLSISLTDTSGTVADAHVDLLAVPAAMTLPRAVVTATVAAAPAADGSIKVTLKTTEPALFVVLTTTQQGVWSDNAFAMLDAGTERRVRAR